MTSRDLLQPSRASGTRPLTLVLALALSLAALLAAPVAAADPLPARDPGEGATTPPPTSPEVATQSSTAFADGDVFVAVSNG